MQNCLRSMYYLWERMKIVVEPTGALAAAALLEGKLDARGKRVGVIISGGNVDVRNLASLGNAGVTGLTYSDNSARRRPRG